MVRAGDDRDRESEVRYLADQVRITQIRALKSPKKSWTSSVKSRLKRRQLREY